MATKKSKKTGGFLLGAALGAVAGAIAGILTAPQSGEKTRSEINKKGKQALRAAKTQGKKIESQSRQAAKNVKKEGKRVTTAAKRKTAKTLNKAASRISK